MFKTNISGHSKI